MDIKELFKIAVSKKASDLHLVVGLSPLVRVDGELMSLNEKKVADKDIEQMAFALINDEQKKRFIDSKELDFSYELTEGSRFRVNLHYERDNIGLVARVINDTTPTIEEVGLSNMVTNLLKLKQGFDTSHWTKLVVVNQLV